MYLDMIDSYAWLYKSARKLSISFSSIFGIDFFVNFSSFNFVNAISLKEAGPCSPTYLSEKKRLW